MKRVIYFVSLLFLFSFIFTSCQKEEIETPSSNFSVAPSAINFNFEIKNNRISFPTIMDYEKALEWLARDELNDFKTWITLTNNFKSQYLLREYDDIKSDIFVEDDLLSNILNSEGEIEIAGKIYKLNNLTKQIQVIDTRNKAEKNFSFNDEVLSYLSKKSDWVNTGICPGDLNWPSSCNPNWEYATARGSFNRKIKISYKVAYYKYGIYFTLIAKIKKEKSDKSIYLFIKTTNDLTKKKNGYCYSKYFTYSDTTNKKVLKIRPYYSTKRLADYKIIGEFSMQDSNGYHPLKTRTCPCD